MGYQTHHEMVKEDQAEAEALASMDAKKAQSAAAAVTATAQAILAPFKVYEFIDDEVATLLARFAAVRGMLPLPERDFLHHEITTLANEVAMRIVMDKSTLITHLANEVHASNVRAGRWSDLKTGEDLHGKRNIGELLALVHSELSEAIEGSEAERFIAQSTLLCKIVTVATAGLMDEGMMRADMLDLHASISRALEGHRKSKMDDKLPHRPMFRVELIDALIRILDTLGSQQNGAEEHPAGVIFCEKRGYNDTRPDHKKENRLKADGKKI